MLHKRGRQFQFLKKADSAILTKNRREKGRGAKKKKKVKEPRKKKKEKESEEEFKGCKM